MNTRSEQLIGATPSPIESVPTPDISLTELEARLGFKIPDISLDELEDKLGFKIPDISLDELDNEPDIKTSTAQPISKTLLEAPPASKPQEVRALDATEPKATFEAPANTSQDNVDPKTKPERRPFNRTRNLAKGVGAFSLSFAVMGGAYSSVHKPSSSSEGKSKTEQIAPPATALETTTTTTEIQPTTTALETTTTTPEAPFSVEPGQVMAYINLPSIEEQVTIFEMSKEHAQAATINNRGGEQLSPIDQLIPDETPNVDNEQVRQWAEETGAITREHRIRGSSQGNANQWESVAGHTQGDTILPDPNHAGNSVIFGHGSTFNAAFANLGALRENDPLIMLRADGKVLNYTFIEKEIMDAPNLNDRADVERALRHMNEYRNGDGKKYVTLYHCGDRNGLPGDDSTRVIFRFMLDE
jgi:sortase (surface protein transpeptidase)